MIDVCKLARDVCFKLYKTYRTQQRGFMAENKLWLLGEGTVKVSLQSHSYLMRNVFYVNVLVLKKCFDLTSPDQKQNTI